jgi:chromosome segregation ATPase
MANDNKNTHELASDLDDTSELELLPDAFSDPALDYEAESDAATHSFAGLDAARARKSVDTLQVELRERDDYIGRLEYELEQLRARTSGIETELKARAALTEGISAELAEARQALTDARARLEERDQAFTELEAALADSRGALQDARQEAEAARSENEALETRSTEDARRLETLTKELQQAAAARREALDAQGAQSRRLAELEERHAESRSLAETLRQYVDGRKERWEQQEILLRSKDDLLREQERRLGELASAGNPAGAPGAGDEAAALQLAEMDSLATQLAEVICEYEKEREERQALEAHCNALEDRIARLTSGMADLETAAERSRPLHRENERLAGELRAYADEVRNSRKQAAKTEAYADTLRRRIQEQSAELEALAAGRRGTEAALEEALAKLAALREEAAAGSRDAAALREDERAARERLEKELDDARAELARGREAAAEAAASNEQLASELVEATGSRLALESQLAQSGEEQKRQVESLERQVERLEQELEDAESKVANKDAAISVLLAELANKPPAAASEVQADAPPQRPAERSSPAADDRHGPEKERTTRLLVGTIDGQEVRFPLFKNKLTIGRTAHNDIQLKQQFISRRHAVVVCDHDSTRIVDWGSKNGIYVNGVRVSEKVLKTGDQLTVGAAEFRFEERPKR